MWHCHSGLAFTGPWTPIQRRSTVSWLFRQLVALLMLMKWIGGLLELKIVKGKLHSTWAAGRLQKCLSRALGENCTLLWPAALCVEWDLWLITVCGSVWARVSLAPPVAAVSGGVRPREVRAGAAQCDRRGTDRRRPWDGDEWLQPAGPWEAADAAEGHGWQHSDAVRLVSEAQTPASPHRQQLVQDPQTRWVLNWCSNQSMTSR